MFYLELLSLTESISWPKGDGRNYAEPIVKNFFIESKINKFKKSGASQIIYYHFLFRTFCEVGYFLIESRRFSSPLLILIWKFYF